METINEDCRCIFFHPRDPARRKKMKDYLDYCLANPGGDWNVYQHIRYIRQLGPCETRGETK